MRRQKRYLHAGPPLRERLSAIRSRMGRRRPRAPVFVRNNERVIAGVVAVLSVLSVGTWWASRTTLPPGEASSPIVSPGPSPTIKERTSLRDIPNPSPDPGPQSSPD